MRHFIELSYFGKNFHGWQIQPNAITVQEVVNEALNTILGEDINVVGAGRTDTGVHAKQMFAHFDFDTNLPENLTNRLNSFLGKDIYIKNVMKMHETAHTRFDAVSRKYHYQILQEKNPFLQDFAWHVFNDLDFDKMKTASQFLFDFEDFTSFSKTNTQTQTNLCQIKKADWQFDGEKWIFEIAADRFLRNMVRAIVGTLVEIGLGKKQVDDFPKIIEKNDRREAGESAPAHGLYLMEVAYPENYFNG